MNRLQGKTAVITGGNSGVGAAAALLFAREGANVVISARRQSALDEAAEKIRAEGGSVLTVATDISKDGDCKALMQAAADKFGKIDILVNNAGVLDTGLKAIDKYLDEDAEKVISINEVGTMQCIRAALEKMSEGASIVNVASVAGYNGGGGRLRRFQSRNYRNHQTHGHAARKPIYPLQRGMSGKHRHAHDHEPQSRLFGYEHDGRHEQTRGFVLKILHGGRGCRNFALPRLRRIQAPHGSDSRQRLRSEFVIRGSNYACA